MLTALKALGWGPTRFVRPGAAVPLGLHLAFTAFATLLTLAAAWLSWNLLERHFLRLKHRFPTRPSVRLTPAGRSRADTVPLSRR